MKSQRVRKEQTSLKLSTESVETRSSVVAILLSLQGYGSYWKITDVLTIKEMTGDNSNHDGEIRDIKSFRELESEMNAVSNLKDALPVLKPALKAIGADVDRIGDSFEEEDINALQQATNEIMTLPDRFNDQFASEGWIFYDMMEFETTKEAVEKAEAGNMEAAEATLVEYYDMGTIEKHLNWMKEADAFMPRIGLAQKALEDYAEERYHASIPVVFSIMDGMVVDAHWEARNQPTGMFFGDPDLRAWDSMTAHINGLERLKPVLNETRIDLETDDIKNPFRHGIVHGRDLGYDNKIVAAKTWAALFAVREWVVKAEKDELDKPDEEEEPSLLEKIEKNQKTKQYLREWESREVSVGAEIPVQGTSDEYEKGTPEQALVQFLEWWMDCNWGYMTNYLRDTDGMADVELIKQQFSTTELQSFSLIEVDDKPAAADVTVKLEYERFGQEETGTAKVRLVRSDEEGEAVIRGHGEADWVMHNWMPLLSPQVDSD